MNNKAEQERKQLNRKLMLRTFANQMQHTFIASLCKNGILGGSLVVDAKGITYISDKVTIPEKYRHLEIQYKDIMYIREGWLLCFPTVLFEMKNDEEHKFIVFSRKRFLEVLNNKQEKR